MWKTETKEHEMIKYTSRGLKPSHTKGKYDVTLSHKDPLTGELVPSYHTVEANTPKQAKKARDELIRKLEQKGAAYTSKTTLCEFLNQFISDKENKHLVERSTIDGYRKEARVISRYIGGMRLADVDPDAKRAAVERVSGSFDIDDSFFDEDDPLGERADPSALTITLTVEQFEKLMAGAKRPGDAA